MTRLRLFLVALVAAVVAALVVAAGPTPAFAAEGNAGNNSATASNTKDGSSLFRFAFDVTKVIGSTVDTTNQALAYASCTDCQTTAIAIQIVLVEGSPTTYTPTNVAVAINESCNLCDTMASAYQFVVQSSGPTGFTPEGRRQLAEIRRSIAALGKGDLTNAEIRAKLDPLIAQLQTVLATELVARGPTDRRDDHEEQTTSTTAPADAGPRPTSTTKPATTETTRPSPTSTTEAGGTSTTARPTTSSTNAPTTSSTAP
jgi:putative peptide zinc metalloprotease protein